MDRIGLLKKLGIINPIDYHFAKLIAELDGSDNAPLTLAACLVSQAVANKHVCLFLPAFSQRILAVSDEAHDAVLCPDIHQWIARLKESPVVGAPGEIKPLILDDESRLYLYRYWQYEKDLGDAINKRVADNSIANAPHCLRETLDRIFPVDKKDSFDRQKLAALVCALKNICVITGGPGTGKTTTVAKILAVLLEISQDHHLNIVMAAPTGKAAVRLRESIISSKTRIQTSRKILDAIPENPQTLHRLLQPVIGTAHFKYNNENPLPADIVVVDEASMVDMALMIKLMQAVPDHARLILIGDKDQLASVETGSVLGDICKQQSDLITSSLHKYLINWMNNKDITDLNYNESACTIEDCIVTLTENYRFSDHKYLETFIKAVKSDKFEALADLFQSSDPTVLEMCKFENLTQFQQKIETDILNGYASYLKTDNVSDALMKFETFKILCVQNKGYFGVVGINRLAETVLMAHQLIDPTVQWYKGRPILINSNDYSLDVFNGDMGIIWPESNQSHAEMFAYFPGRDGNMKKILPQRLPAHETGYAMTIHKTQGSEFDTVLMILPTYDSPLLTRELLYTGITRTRKKLTIWAEPYILKTAMSRKIQRHSGLSGLLSVHSLNNMSK